MENLDTCDQDSAVEKTTTSLKYMIGTECGNIAAEQTHTSNKPTHEQQGSEKTSSFTNKRRNYALVCDSQNA